MATRSLPDVLAKLDALNIQGGDVATEFDVLLSEIASLNDPSCIRHLLKLFNDEAQYDELMFSIIHTIESFDVQVYIAQIMRELPSLFRSSPRWAIVLHMRILNDPESRSAYASALQSLQPAEAHASREILNGVKQKRKEFAARCDELLAYLR
jgi:hypothetical protein